MAQNPIPTNGGQLIGLGTRMEAGVAAVGTSVGVTMVTAKQIQTGLDAFSAADAAFNAARSARQAASDTYQTACDLIYTWLLAVRKVLAVRFGDRWSTQWAQAGFTNATTAIPIKVEDRLSLGLLLVKFFTANPTYAVATMNVTAARGTALRNTALTAQQALATAAVKLGTLGVTWQTAYAALTTVMRKLLKNLDGVLARNDPRWEAFGLNVPASPATPGKPVNLTAHTDETGAIVVQCDAVPLATRYRFRMLLVGFQTDYHLAASSPAPLGTIKDVKPGQKVEIIAQAVNGNLQGVASAPLFFTMPATQSAGPKQAPEAKAPRTTGQSEIRKNGNGNGNGHAALSRIA